MAGRVRAAVPSASGWFSGKALLPLSVVATGTPVQLGQPHQLGGGVRVEHALAGQDHRDGCGRRASARSARRPPARPASAAAATSARPSRRRPPAPFSTSLASATSTGPLRDAAQRVQRPAEHLGAAAGVVEVAAKRVIGRYACSIRKLGAESCSATACSAGQHQDRAAVAVGLGDRAERRPPHRARTGSRRAAIRSPLVARANPSAMLTATRSVRVMIGRMPSSDAEFEQPVLGEADDGLGALALEQFSDAVGDERLSQLVYRNTAYTRRDCRRWHVRDPPRPAASPALGATRDPREARQAELAYRPGSARPRAAAARRPGRRPCPARPARSWRARDAWRARARSAARAAARAPRRPPPGASRTKPGTATAARPAASATRLTLNGSCTMSSRRATSGSATA